MTVLKKEFYYHKVKETLEYLSNLISQNSDEALNPIMEYLPSELTDSFNGGEIIDSPVFYWIYDENLSDEEKEEIALNNRSAFDELIRLCSAFSEKMAEYEKKHSLYNDNTQFLHTLFLTAISRQEIYHNTQDAVKDICPIILTTEELYWALKFLSSEQIRAVLSEQTPQIFSKLIKAFNEGKDSFLTIINEVEYKPMSKLRWFLYAEIDKLDPFLKYLESTQYENQEAYHLLIEYLVRDQSTGIKKASDELISLSLDDETSIDDCEKFCHNLTLMNNDLHKQVSNLLNLDIFTIPERKRIVSMYEEWCTLYPTSPSLDIANDSTDSESYYQFMFKIKDRWVLENITKRMNQNGRIDSKDTNNTTSNYIGLGEGKRISFPTRISKNRPMELDIKKQIMDGLYSAFGSNLENYEGDPITKEEFSYLFGGPEKRPVNYQTPYYWNTSAKQFAGLLRLLYFGQETGIDEIILLSTDKDKKKSSVKWSAKKQGLGKTTLKPIEEQIQNIIFGATGARLSEVDLTKQNKPKKK
ncbi:MAG: hypothetical protein HDR86_00745 [Bacteroides sp.]|nr:hypothetical protein [Bacteroides sp.]